jgi:long-chain acyl-CoA synthetase
VNSKEVFEKYIKTRPWVKNYDEGVPPDVEIRPEPLYVYLDRSAAYGDRPAYIYFGGKV